MLHLNLNLFYLILTKLEIDNLKINQYNKKQQHWLFMQKWTFYFCSKSLWFSTMLVTRKLTVAIDFHSIFIYTMGING